MLTASSTCRRRIRKMRTNSRKSRGVDRICQVLLKGFWIDRHLEIAFRPPHERVWRTVGNPIVATDRAQSCDHIIRMLEEQRCLFQRLTAWFQHLQTFCTRRLSHCSLDSVEQMVLRPGSPLVTHTGALVTCTHLHTPNSGDKVAEFMDKNTKAKKEGYKKDHSDVGQPLWHNSFSAYFLYALTISQ